MSGGLGKFVLVGLVSASVNANAASLPFSVNGQALTFSGVKLNGIHANSLEAEDDDFWVQDNLWVRKGGKIVQLTHIWSFEPAGNGKYAFSGFSNNHEDENDEEEGGDEGQGPNAHPNLHFPHQHFPNGNFPVEVFPSSHYPGKFDDYPFPWTGSYPTPSPIPVPAAIWLFGSGLMGVMVLVRRKSGMK